MGFSVQSFESSGISKVPDLYLVETRRGFSIWIELKVEKDNRMSFMDGQPGWLEGHRKKGGLAYVLCLHSSGHIRLYDGKSARWLASVRMDKAGLHGLAIAGASLVSGPCDWPSTWDGILAKLVADAEDSWGRS